MNMNTSQEMTFCFRIPQLQWAVLPPRDDKVERSVNNGISFKDPVLPIRWKVICEEQEVHHELYKGICKWRINVELLEDEDENYKWSVEFTFRVIDCCSATATEVVEKGQQALGWKEYQTEWDECSQSHRIYGHSNDFVRIQVKYRIKEREAEI